MPTIRPNPAAKISHAKAGTPVPANPDASGTPVVAAVWAGVGLCPGEEAAEDVLTAVPIDSVTVEGLAEVVATSDVDTDCVGVTVGVDDDCDGVGDEVGVLDEVVVDGVAELVWVEGHGVSVAFGVGVCTGDDGWPAAPGDVS